jgi:phosphatidate cytidylyltransferase
MGVESDGSVALGEASAREHRTADSLRERVMSGVVFLPILIYVTWVGGLAFVGLVSLVVYFGLQEFYGMLQARGERPYRMTGILAGLLLVWYAHFREGLHANLLLTVVLIGLMAAELVRKDNRGALATIAGTVFGVFYVAWLGSHLVFLRGLPELAGLSRGATGTSALGAYLVFFLFLCAWGCDTGAYLVGSFMGRHPLLPRVSPRKSIEGAVGGLLAGTLAGWIAALTFASFLPPWAGAVCGFILSVASQLGDMVESLLKRSAARKDSAVVLGIPGHGGVLDRFDSVLFAAPAFYYVMKAIYM